MIDVEKTRAALEDSIADCAILLNRHPEGINVFSSRIATLRALSAALGRAEAVRWGNGRPVLIVPCDEEEK